MRQAAQSAETMHRLNERKRRRAYCLLKTMAMSWDHCWMSHCNVALPAVLCTCPGFNSPHRAMWQVSCWEGGGWLLRALLSGQCLEIYWRTAVSVGKRRRVLWHTASSAVWSLLPSAGVSCNPCDNLPKTRRKMPQCWVLSNCCSCFQFRPDSPIPYY